MKAAVSSVMTMLALVLVTPVFAAFPAHTGSTSTAPVETPRHSFEEFISSTIEKYDQPRVSGSDGIVSDGGTLSIISFSLGLGAVIAAALPIYAPVLLCATVGLSIAAIITGIKGAKRRPLRGLGIAGFILGIVEIGTIVLMLLLLLLISIFMP